MNISRFFPLLPKALTRGLAVAAIGTPMMWSAGAHATLISIGLQEAGVNGGKIVTVADDKITPGTALFGGSTFGDFTFTASSAITATGAPTSPQGSLSTTSIQTSATTAATLNIYITEQGLTSPSGLTTFLSAFTSNAFQGNAISVVETSLVSTSNALFSGTQMATTTFNSPATATGSGTPISSIVSLSGTYSETVVYTVTVGSGYSQVNDSINMSATAVPEPVSLAVLGCGLFGLGFAKRRKSDAAAV